MKYTKLFIEKAIEGGWKKDLIEKGYKFHTDGVGYHFILKNKKEHKETFRRDNEAVLLDPSSWRAVGKVEGWGNIVIHNHGTTEKCTANCGKSDFKDKMNGLSPALQEGKSIEEYLSTLFK